MLDQTLKLVLQMQNMSLQDLADKADVPIETLRNIYYGKVNNPKVQTVYEISKALNVSMNYLMGSSELNEEEKRIVMNYRKCGIHGRAFIHAVAEAEADAAVSEKNAVSRYEVSCLIPTGNFQDGMRYGSANRVSIKTDMRNAYMAIEITSNFFSPVYCKGDRVLLEDRFPYNGEQAVFIDGDYIYLRHFIELDKKYELHDVNGRGKCIKLRRTDQMKCVGTCIGVIRA